MKPLFGTLSVIILLAGCHGGSGSTSTNSNGKYPHAALQGTANKSDSGGPLWRKDGTPVQGDTSTSNNGQNTGLIKDSSGRKK